MTNAATLDPPGSLATADWLERHLHHPDLVVLDATAPHGASGPDRELGIAHRQATHIPGSRHADLVADLSDSDASFSFAFPEAARLVPALQALDIGAGTTIVIYDNFLDMWATRLWWMLRAISVDAVAILDGGWKAWAAGGHPTEAGPQTALPRRRALHAVPRPAFVDIGRVLAHVATPRAGEALISVPDATPPISRIATRSSTTGPRPRAPSKKACWTPCSSPMRWACSTCVADALMRR